MHDKLKGEKIELENARETLGHYFFIKLKEIEASAMLDHTISGFLDHFCLINKVSSENGYFLRFYERRKKFRYQLRQKLKTKKRSEKNFLQVQSKYLMDTSYLVIILIMLKEKISFRETLCTSQLLTQKKLFFVFMHLIFI